MAKIPRCLSMTSSTYFCAMTKLILSIDPGKSGGFAWHYQGGTVACERMPDVEAEIVSFIVDLVGAYISPDMDDRRGNIAYIEKVGGYAGTPQPGSRMFTFGRNVGIIMGALYAAGFRIHEVAPTRWQMKLGVNGIDAKKRKAEFRNKAHQLFPHLGKAITLKTADALLIHSYACHIEGERI